MQIPAMGRERLQRLPLITLLVFFSTLIAVGFLRIPGMLLLWLAAWCAYALVRFVIAARRRLR